MPVRSLNSSVLTWPDRTTVVSALTAWATETASRRKDICRIGYFGSYARGNWGVGSDLDVAVILRSTDKPIQERSREFDTISLPVPVDLLVYSQDELAELPSGRFKKVIESETVWVYGGEFAV